ncbi:hypothetical protein [Caulobacter sp. DWR1-3-2b1]
MRLCRLAFARTPPAGWASLLAVALIIGAGIWALMVVLPGA